YFSFQIRSQLSLSSANSLTNSCSSSCVPVPSSTRLCRGPPSTSSAETNSLSVPATNFSSTPPTLAAPTARLSSPHTPSPFSASTSSICSAHCPTVMYLGGS